MNGSMGKIGQFCSRGLFVSVVFICLSCNEYNWVLPKDKKVNQNIAALISVNFVYKTKTNCWRDSLV